MTTLDLHNKKSWLHADTTWSSVSILDCLNEFKFSKCRDVDAAFWLDEAFFWLVADFDHDVFDVATDIMVDSGGDFAFATSKTWSLSKVTAYLM